MIGPSKAMSVEDGDGGVGEGGGVDDDAGGASARRVDPVDDLVFAVALAELDVELKLGPEAAAVRLDVGQGSYVDFYRVFTHIQFVRDDFIRLALLDRANNCEFTARDGAEGRDPGMPSPPVASKQSIGT